MGHIIIEERLGYLEECNGMQDESHYALAALSNLVLRSIQILLSPDFLID